MRSKSSNILSHLVTVLLLAALLLGFLPGTSAQAAGAAAFTRPDLVANIETVGVLVSGTGLPKTATLMYQKSGETDWRAAHPMLLSNNTRLVGSLFGLAPSTQYNIKVMDGATEISGSVTTQPEELQFVPAGILYVDDDAAAGGDGSKSRPFKTIQEGVNRAAPGTQVLVADGVYRESVSFPASGEEGQEYDACEYGNACDPGLLCAGLGNDDSGKCDAQVIGCCLAFCDLTAPAPQCTSAQDNPNSLVECVSWYEEGMAPPGYENVGVCIVPA